MGLDECANRVYAYGIGGSLRVGGHAMKDLITEARELCEKATLSSKGGTP